MTQEQLGTLLGKTKSYIYQLEAGRRDNPDASLVMLFETMEMNPAAFVENKQRLNETPAAYRVRVLETGKPIGEKIVEVPSGDDVIDHLVEVLRDFRNASRPTRRILMREIDEMVGGLRAEVFGEQSQSQSQ